MVRISCDPIDTEEAYRELSKKGAGSVLLHYAVVKPQDGSDGTTCHIDFSSDGDSEGELRHIAAEIKSLLNLEDLLLVRRVGRVKLGEVISVVAATSPNSEDAFEACRLGIARLRRMKTIVKNEVRR
ncbi:molybdenum cofactor biosynthesis protein MoaE [Geomonas sp. RF6]|uniref:molybdenum cofactor biosynthesis protein MoaE n=1 Tax=Geomonas sp. RF6 TaxID=2897342 RepID=UPI001E502933|nr:molybdenum cofactor biosynthesis protein MoaE [Geomonas sp. RF6]UFS70967.1 molybdenum cofactor biosynthesis protein MoaE [Geomonas sp. RF6]